MANDPMQPADDPIDLAVRKRDVVGLHLLELEAADVCRLLSAMLLAMAVLTLAIGIFAIVAA
jgi:hypothetical protein